MDANSILNDEMTLEEKLQSISDAMEQAQQVANQAASKLGLTAAPVDPASLTICDGCE